MAAVRIMMSRFNRKIVAKESADVREFSLEVERHDRLRYSVSARRKICWGVRVVE